MENMNVLNELDVCKVALNAGIVKFWYTKIDGSRREAIGTRNPEIISALGGQPKGEREDRKEQNPLIFCYYDFGKAAWRCFRTDLFGGLLFEKMSREQAAAEVLKNGREEGDDELAKMVAVRLVGDTMAAAMFSGILQDLPVEAVVERATAPSRPAAPSRASESVSAKMEKIWSSGHHRADLVEELKRLRAREEEILQILLY